MISQVIIEGTELGHNNNNNSGDVENKDSAASHLYLLAIRCSTSQWRADDDNGILTGRLRICLDMLNGLRLAEVIDQTFLSVNHAKEKREYGRNEENERHCHGHK